MRAFLAAVLIGGLSTPVAAEEWYYVAHSDEGIMFADADSIRRVGEAVAVAGFFGSADPLDLRLEHPSYVIWYEIAQIEFICSSGQSRVTHVDSYNERHLLEYSTEVEERWAALPDDSLARGMHAFACEGTRISQAGDPFDFTDEILSGSD